MGLDISAYRQLKLLKTRETEDGYVVDVTTGERLENYCYVFIEEGFEDRAEDLVNRAYYAYGDSMGFRAGGYSGYSDWRETLARIAGYPQVQYSGFRGVELRHDAAAWNATHGPFWELINFSDCEGTLGAAVAAKLVRDFQAYRPQAEAEGGSFLEKYLRWEQAFVMAADGGAVRFH